MRSLKSFDPELELKADAPGAFRATVAQFGVVDKDGDVTFKGAFPLGKEIVISAYGHSSWNGVLPVGKGVIGADDNKAWVDGNFFDTVAGQDTYKTVKGLFPLGEWSYAYDPKQVSPAGAPEMEPYPEARRGLLQVDVYEASPVLLGAGVGTGTDWVKSAGGLDHAARAVAEAAAYIESEQANIGIKEGRAISAERRKRMAAALTAFREAAKELEALLDETDPEKGATAFLSFERTRAGLAQHGIYI